MMPGAVAPLAQEEPMHSSLNPYRVPVFLISYNRLSYLRQLVAWLQTAGYENIHIVDNASTYSPLLDYLRQSPHHVHRLKSNYGHLAVWKCGQFDSIVNRQFFVVSDCDVVPVEECPINAVEFFYESLQKHDAYTKAGFSLKIDDLPDTYVYKTKVIDWEKQFWQPELGTGLIEAAIDTTFALYRPGIPPSEERWWKSIRTCFPYTARHLPWYQDSKNLSPEELYYQTTLNGIETYWSVTDAVVLKEQNIAYQNEIRQLRRELRRLREDYWRIHKNPRDLIRAAFRRGWRSSGEKAKPGRE